MKIFLALLATSIVSLGVIVVSLCFLMWLSNRYDDYSPQYRLARFATFWMDMLIGLVNSFLIIRAIAQTTQDPVLLTILFILIVIGISTYAIKNRHPSLIVGVTCTTPFILWEIWHNHVTDVGGVIFIGGIGAILYFFIMSANIVESDTESSNTSTAKPLKDEINDTSISFITLSDDETHDTYVSVEFPLPPDEPKAF